MLLNPNEQIKGTIVNVLDFWKWAYSDILSNRNRSIFAEFLVAAALNTNDKPRIEWDAKDLVYKDVNIEIKSSAYVQSWDQDKPSVISFDIAKKKAWDSNTNISSEIEIRISDIYIFCLYLPYDKSHVKLLDVENWTFYVMTEKDIERVFKDTKKISLSRVKEESRNVKYNELKQFIDQIIVDNDL